MTTSQIIDFSKTFEKFNDLNQSNREKISMIERDFFSTHSNESEIHSDECEIFFSILPNLNSLLENKKTISLYAGRGDLFFSKLKVVSYGVYGTIFEALSHFILKYPNDSVNYPSIIHEGFVGVRCTNLLREMGIYNFSYVYGVEYSSNPVFCGNLNSSGDNVLSFYPSKIKVPYCIYEKVEGNTLSKHLSTMSLNSFSEMLTQICLSIGVGYFNFNFTHFDLHDENIIQRPIEGEIPIDYKFKSEIFRLHVKEFISTIIDFGFSFFKDDENYTLPTQQGLFNFGILDQPNPLCDIYKLLCYSASRVSPHRSSSEEARKIYNFIEEIIKFFNEEESLDEILLRQKSFSYFYPLTTKKFEDLIDVIIINSPFLKIERVLIEEFTPESFTLFEREKSESSLLSRVDLQSEPSLSREIDSPLLEVNYFPQYSFKCKLLIFDSEYDIENILNGGYTITFNSITDLCKNPITIKKWMNRTISIFRSYSRAIFINEDGKKEECEKVINGLITQLHALYTFLYAEHSYNDVVRYIKELKNSTKWYTRDVPSFFHLLENFLL